MLVFPMNIVYYSIFESTISLLYKDNLTYSIQFQYIFSNTYRVQLGWKPKQHSYHGYLTYASFFSHHQNTH
jgi:hypothetical protein